MDAEWKAHGILNLQQTSWNATNNRKKNTQNEENYFVHKITTVFKYSKCSHWIKMERRDGSEGQQK